MKTSRNGNKKRLDAYAEIAAIKRCFFRRDDPFLYALLYKTYKMMSITGCTNIINPQITA